MLVQAMKNQNLILLNLEFRDAGLIDIHRGPRSLPGRVRVTSTTIPAQYGPYHVDQRASQNISISSATHH